MSTFTIIHVIISLIAIISGLVVFWSFLIGKQFPAWTGVFLTMTVATSVTGFFYLPFLGFTPAQGFGVLSMIILALAIYSLNVRHLAGVWCRVYVITALIALYLNVFVLVVQSFQKIPALNALAPTGSEPPFFIAQGIVFVLFLGLGIRAALRYPAAIKT